MKPFQPRLLHESRAAQRWVAIVVACGLAGAVMAIVIAVLLGRVLADAVTGHETLSGAATPLVLVACIAVMRGLVMSAAEYAGHLGAREVIAALRGRLLHALADGGPGMLHDQRTGAVAEAATTGIESLDTYFGKYLPQLVLGTAIPVLVLVFLAAHDLLSAVIVGLTLPLIPVFMWLVGASAQNRMDRRWALMQRLGAYFLDVIEGLPTLRIFGRAEGQVERVRTITDAARRATMGTLAVAFLSSLVLEFLASIATALVAAEIGLRLVDGSMSLQTGLTVLIVVPEAYMPLRQLGTFYHSSTEGLSAATTVLDLTDRSSVGLTAEGTTTVPAPSLATSPITFSGVTCIHGDRGEGVVAPIDVSLGPLTTTLLTGASGVGKSTLLHLLVPLQRPTSGVIRVGSADLTDVDLDSWRTQIGWVPQHPALFRGSILDNLRLGAPDAGEDDATAILRRLFPDRMPDVSVPLTQDGEGVSGGERIRIALARALLRSPQLLLLDEPTAFLDPRSALAVVGLLQEIAVETTLVIATHEPDRFPWADRIIDLETRPREQAVGERVAIGAGI